MKRKEHLLIVQDHRAKSSVGSLRFIFFFLFLTQVSFAQTVKYDINDPRNPDCPCHKLQKQAEDEFSKLNYKDKINVVEVNNKEANHEVVAEQKKVNANSVTSTGVKKRKKKPKLFNQLRFKYSRKIKRTPKVNPDYSVCWKW